MRDNGLMAPNRPQHRPAHPHEGTIVTERVDEVWGTDMTQTVTIDEGRAYVFNAVDHWSGEFIGINATHSANRFEALEPIRQGVTKHFNGMAENAALGLTMDELTLPLTGLSPVLDKDIVARFDGGTISSDGGLLVLREIE